MSRIGIQPITVPSGVTVKAQDGLITLQGAKGSSTLRLPAGVELAVEKGVLTLKRANDERATVMNHGTTRSLLAGKIEGVSKGYSIDLEIQGVGFKAALKGDVLVLNLGFSHEINHKIPAGITVKVTEGTSVNISGVEKQLVGDVAARIRSYYKAEPYKGKGVRYKGEKVRRKAGKTAA